MAEDKGDRSQPATQRRKDKAREDGQVPLSREVAGLAGLGGATLVFVVAGPAMARSGAGRLAGLLAGMHTLEAAPALREAALATLVLVAPIALAVMLSSVASSLLQTGFALRLNAPAPDLSRISPRKGLGRIFGVGGLVEQAKALVKFAVLGWAAWHVLSGAMPMMTGAVLWLPGQVADHLMRQVLQLMLTLLGAQAVIAAADVAWVRHRHFSGLRMSREEIKQEGKETEGNPQVKARLRQLRHSRAKHCRQHLRPPPAPDFHCSGPKQRGSIQLGWH